MKRNPLSKCVEILDNIGIWVSAACIIFTMFYVSADVLGRLLLKRTIGGGTEALICLITVWVAYMSLSYTTKTGGHVAMTFFSGKLYGRAKLIDEIFVSSMTLLFYVVMFYAAWKMFMTDFTHNTIVDATFSFKLRLWWGQIAMPIGCAVQVLASLGSILENIYDLIHGNLPQKELTIQEEIKAEEEKAAKSKKTGTGGEAK